MKFRQQVIFWILTLVVMALIFGGGNGNYTESFYFVCMLLPVAICTSWYFNEVLVHKYLMRRRFLKFGLYFIYSMIISLWLQMLVVTVSLIILANYSMERMNPLTTNVKLLGIIIYLVVFIQAFIQMFMEMNIAKTQADKLKNEDKIRSKGYILVRSDRKNHKINYDDILFVESLSDYVKIILKKNDVLISKETISGLNDRLPSNFIRIHRSFIIHREKITSFNSEEVRIGDQILPISRKYKSGFMQIMNPSASIYVDNSDEKILNGNPK